MGGWRKAGGWELVSWLPYWLLPGLLVQHQLKESLEVEVGVRMEGKLTASMPRPCLTWCWVGEDCVADERTGLRVACLDLHRLHLVIQLEQAPGAARGS